MSAPAWSEVERELRSRGYDDEKIKKAKRLYFDDISQEPEFIALPEETKASYRLKFLGDDDPSFLSKIATYGKQFIGEAQEVTQNAIDSAAQLAVLGAKSIPSLYGQDLDKIPGAIRDVGDWLREKSPLGSEEVIPPPDPDEVYNPEWSPIPIPKTLGAAGNVASHLAAGALPYVALGGAGLLGEGAGIAKTALGFAGFEGGAALARGEDIGEAAKTAGKTALGIFLLGGGQKTFGAIFKHLRSKGVPEAEAAKLATEATKVQVNEVGDPNKYTPTDESLKLALETQRPDVTAPEPPATNELLAPAEEVPGPRTLGPGEEPFAWTPKEEVVKESPPPVEAPPKTDVTAPVREKPLQLPEEEIFLPDEKSQQPVSSKFKRLYLLARKYMGEEDAVAFAVRGKFPTSDEITAMDLALMEKSPGGVAGAMKKSYEDMRIAKSTARDRVLAAKKAEEAPVKDVTAPEAPPEVVLPARPLIEEVVLPEKPIPAEPPQAEMPVPPVEVPAIPRRKIIKVKAPGGIKEPPPSVEPALNLDKAWEGSTPNEKLSMLKAIGVRGNLDPQSPAYAKLSEARATASAKGGDVEKLVSILSEKAKNTPPPVRPGERGAVPLEAISDVVEGAKQRVGEVVGDAREAALGVGPYGARSHWTESNLTILENRVESLGPKGKALKAEMDNLMHDQKEYESSWTDEVHRAISGPGKILRPELDRINATRVLSGKPALGRDGKPVPTSPVTASIAEKARPLLKRIWETSQANKVVGLKEYVENYATRLWKEKVFRSLESAKTGSEYYKLIEDSAKKQNPQASQQEISDAINERIKLQRNMRTRGEAAIPDVDFSPLTKSRVKIDIPEQMIEMDIAEWLPYYARGAAKLNAWTRMAPKVLPVARDLLAELENWKPKINEKTGLQEGWIEEPPTTSLGKLVSEFLHQRLGTGTSQYSPFLLEHPVAESAIRGMGQLKLSGISPGKNFATIINAAIKGDMVSFFRGMFAASEKAPIGVSGEGFFGRGPTTLAGAPYRAATSAFPLSEVVVRKLTARIGAENVKSLYKKALDGDLLASEQLAEMTTNPDGLTAEVVERMRGVIKDSGLNDAALRGELPENMRRAVMEFSNETALPMQTTARPVSWTKSPLGRIMTYFMPFSLQQAVKVKGLIVDEGLRRAVAEFKLGNTKMGAARLKLAGERFAKLVTLYPAAGTLIEGAWSALRGKFEESFIQKIRREVGSDDELDKKILKIMGNWLKAGVYVGFVGIIGDEIGRFMEESKSIGAGSVGGFVPSSIGNIKSQTGGTSKTVAKIFDPISLPEEKARYKRELTSKLVKLSRTIYPGQNWAEGAIALVTPKHLPARATIGDAKTYLAELQRSINKSIDEGDAGYIRAIWPKYRETIQLRARQAMEDGDLDTLESMSNALDKLDTALEQYQTRFKQKKAKMNSRQIKAMAEK